MAPIIAISAALLLVASQMTQVSAHMMMSSPAPRQSVNNPGPGGAIDYSYSAPLSGIGAFPCKGYPAQAPVLTVAAGSSIPVQVTGGANHGGGHCQFAISYDGDKSWVVLDTVIRSCLAAGAQSFNIPLPSSAPSGKATFGWTWINAVGNREFYSNCADIQVTGGSGPTGSLTGPALFVANIGNHPVIPEFGSPSLPDMHELLDQRPTVTISGNGGASSAPARQAAPPAAAPAAPPAAPAPPAAAPAQSAPQAPVHRVPLPQPQAARPRAACASGQFQCDGPNQWALCTPARVWVSQPAPPGTRCRDDSGAVIFERA